MITAALNHLYSWAFPAQAPLVVQVRQHCQFLCQLASPLVLLILCTLVPTLLPSGPQFVLCSPYQCVKMVYVQCLSLWSCFPVVGQLFMWQDNLILFGSTLDLIAFHQSLVWQLSAGNLIFNSVFVVWKLFVFILSHSDVLADVISAVWCLNKHSGAGFYCDDDLHFYLHVNWS